VVFQQEKCDHCAKDAMKKSRVFDGGDAAGKWDGWKIIA